MKKFIWKFWYITTMIRNSACTFEFANMCADSWIEAFGYDECSGQDAALEEMSYWGE